MNQEEEKLFELCSWLAKDRKWQRKPFDASEIDALAQYYYETAIMWAPVDLENRTKNLRDVYGAIEVMIASISGPNYGDPKSWFNESLQILLFIADPYSEITSQEGLEFLKKLEVGINKIRGQNI